MRCSLVGDKNKGYAEYAEINYLAGIWKGLNHQNNKPDPWEVH